MVSFLPPDLGAPVFLTVLVQGPNPWKVCVKLLQLDLVMTHGSYPACGDQLIMALSYTQQTSDNSLITKYVRKTVVLLLALSSQLNL
jgi:hypothetical protein